MTGNAYEHRVQLKQQPSQATDVLHNFPTEAKLQRVEVQMVRGCQHLIAAELSYQFHITRPYFRYHGSLGHFDHFQLFRMSTWVFC